MNISKKILFLLVTLTSLSTNITSNDPPTLQDQSLAKIYKIITDEYQNNIDKKKQLDDIFKQIIELMLPPSLTDNLIEKLAKDPRFSQKERLSLFLKNIYLQGKKKQWEEAQNLCFILYSTPELSHNTSPMLQLINYLTCKNYFHKNFFILFRACAQHTNHPDAQSCNNGEFIKNSIIHNNDHLLRLFIDAKFKIDFYDNKGYSPVLWASRNGRYKCLKLLLDAGANPCDTTTHPDVHHYHTIESKSALELAEYYGHNDCRILLLEAQEKL